MTHRGTRVAVLLVAVVYVVVAAVLVFSPISGQLGRLTVRLHEVWRDDLHLPTDPSAADFETALNVLLFVPAGFLLTRLARVRWWVAALLCVVASGAVETTQAVVLTNRYASLHDVVANAAGGLLGAIVARVTLGRRTARP